MDVDVQDRLTGHVPEGPLPVGVTVPGDPVPLPDLPSGVYRHYKGPLYLVLGYGHDANVEGRDVVVYLGLQLDPDKPGPRLAVRTALDFLASVCSERACPAFGDDLEDGHSCPEGHAAPRFEYVGPSYVPGP